MLTANHPSFPIPSLHENTLLHPPHVQFNSLNDLFLGSYSRLDSFSSKVGGFENVTFSRSLFQCLI